MQRCFALFYIYLNTFIYSLLSRRRRLALRYRAFIYDIYQCSMKARVWGRFYREIFEMVGMRSYYVVLYRVLCGKKGGVYFEWGPGLSIQAALKFMRKVY